MFSKKINKDKIHLEAEVEEITTHIELSISGKPNITASIDIEARLIKIVIIGICILAVLTSTLLGFVAYIFIS